MTAARKRPRPSISTRYHLSFRIDPLEGYDLLGATGHANRDDAEREFRQALYHAFGLKLYSVAWAETPLDDDELVKRVVERVQVMSERGMGRFGDIYLFETAHPAEDYEWYEIRGGDTGYDADFTPWDYISCRAFQFAPPPHFLGGHFVSERFKLVAEQRGLTGLEFLWVRDRGRYRAPAQWYCGIATQPMGHGLDHEAYDRDKAERRVEELFASGHPTHPTADGLIDRAELSEIEARSRANLQRELDPIFASGRIEVGAADLRDGWTTGGDAIDALVRLAREQGSGFTLAAQNQRFLRAHLPDADFGYAWSIADGPNAHGEWTRFRTTFCTRHARDVLIEDGVLRSEDFVGTLLFSEPPAGVGDLDVGVECPPPFRTSEELARLRKDEVRFRTRHDATEKPLRQPTLKRSLSALRRAKRDRPGDFSKGAAKKTLETAVAELPVPASWRAALAVARSGNFGTEDLSCVVPDLGELTEFHRTFESFETERDDEYPTDRFYFAHTYDGDHFAFELPGPVRVMSGRAFADLPVIQVDHETGEIARRWTGVADFLESVL